MKNVPGLELLIVDHAGLMRLKNGREINYGVIRLTDDEVIYYTGMGLREIYKNNMTEEESERADKLRKIMNEKNCEQKLITLGHIAVTKFEDIAEVLY